MDSHRSASPTGTPFPAGVDATNGSADGDVTRRRQTVEHAPASAETAIHLEIVEFHDVHRRDDRMWTATHFGCGVVIDALTFELLEMVEAPIVRIAHSVRVSGLSA
ncbi:hypothetical protein ACGFNP_14890 [Nonomuraea sp. NPDC049269]|uniref:hypothetical protein n=1 Tax=Nonomuraea sp. NPDC049269 TaxID=3364349 RepID=UPI0037112AF0